MDSIFMLNPVAALIWDCLHGRAIGEVVACVSAEFDVSTDEAAADARALIDELVALKAVRAVPSGTSESIP